MKDRIFDVLPFLLIGDLILPFLFALTYRGHDHLTQVMSALGNPKAPLHILYNIWLIVLGIAILFCNFRLYPIFAEKSRFIAIMLFVIICVYAIGACILSGIFPVGETKELKTISANIHGYGSALDLCFWYLPHYSPGCIFSKLLTDRWVFFLLSVLCSPCYALRFSLWQINRRFGEASSHLKGFGKGYRFCSCISRLLLFVRLSKTSNICAASRRNS